MVDQQPPIGAVVLAAGLATRMGRSKLDLPWPRGGSMLGRVLDVLLEGGVDSCVVVTGGHRQEIEKIAADRGVESVFNQDFGEDDMLTSIKVGLAALQSDPAGAALIMPADHPLLQSETVRGLITAWRKQPDCIWIPSYNHRRGHPVMMPRAFWPELASQGGQGGMRTFLSHRESDIEHLNVNDEGVRMDIDDITTYQSLRDLIEP
jgi:molybdenum cofactor cytidylyltransferase